MRLTEADLARLTGSAPRELSETLPSARELLRQRHWTYAQLWEAVRAGTYWPTAFAMGNNGMATSKLRSA